MSEPWLSEIEQRLTEQQYAINDLSQQVVELQQQLPRAWQQNPGTGGGDLKIYWALSDGGAAATGTWPTGLSAASYITDVYEFDGVDMVLAEADGVIYWPYPDALENEGALVACVKMSNGGYVGIVESCTPLEPDA